MSDFTVNNPRDDSRPDSDSASHFSRMGKVFWVRSVPAGELLHVSSAFALVFGRTVHDLHQRPALWLEMLHPGDVDRAAGLLTAARRGEIATGRYRIIRGDGAIRWVDEEISPVMVEGKVVRLAGTVVDVTDRQRAEQELRMYRELVAADPRVVLLARPADGFRLISINAAGERHFGRAAAEMVGRPLGEVDLNFNPAFCEALWSRLKTQGTLVCAGAHVCADGVARRIEVETSLQQEGDLDLLALTFREPVPVRPDGAALRERDERLHEQAALLDAASDAIILRALDGTIRFFNRGAELLLGWTRAEAAGRKPAELFFRGERSDESATRAVLAHGVWNGEVEHLTRAGDRILVESRWTLIRDSFGEPRAILTINTDVTARRNLEAGALRAQRLESIGTLAGGIAHDLNNILAPIILCGDMLRPRFAGTPEEELIDTIGVSARRGADVVRQVLSFARGVESTRIPVNFRHLIPEVRKIVRETFRRDITCTTEAANELWSILAEPTQLHQVLLNLCINAADAMPGGGTLRIEAANVELDAIAAAGLSDARPGAYVRVRVSDTGIGIPEKIRHRVFDPFFTTKGLGKGTGLGLSTTLAIVRGHGGCITVDSEVNRGTTFSLFFPAENAAAASLPGMPAAPSPRGRNELVLVIDDEQSVRAIVQQGLEEAGYRVLTASDGAEGIAHYTRHQADIALVLTDLMMPVMDGLKVIRHLQGPDAGVRIIAMSGAAEVPGAGSTIVPPGAIAFLLKPFTLDSLLQTVRTTLDQPAAGAA